MLKKILLIIALLYAAAAFAAVDANKATAAELDGIKGIGPGLSGRILEERKNGDFKDWNDFISRVNGVGEKTASRFSADGLTVQGKKFSAAAVAKARAKSTAKASGNAQKDTDAVSARSNKDAAPAPTPSAPPAAASTSKN